MKKIPIIFLKFTTIFIGICTFAFLLLEPHIEGVNANATNLYEIYLNDPFLILVYIGSVPFFLGLYKVFKILTYIKQDKVFSQDTIEAVKKIKHCAMTVIVFVILEEIFIISNHGNDDPIGGVFIGAIIIFCSVVIFAITSIFENILEETIK